jgi:hypothetical protein
LLISLGALVKRLRIGLAAPAELMRLRLVLQHRLETQLIRPELMCQQECRVGRPRASRRQRQRIPRRKLPRERRIWGAQISLWLRLRLRAVLDKNRYHKIGIIEKWPMTGSAARDA